MADVVVRATQPALAAIKLAWWRERLEELDQGIVPAEPRLRAAAAHLLPRGVSGADLAGMEEGWALLLNPGEPDAFKRGAGLRGQALFEAAARLIGVPLDDQLRNAATCFAAADLARRGIRQPAPGDLRPSTKAPRRARRLSALGALARRDLEKGGPPFEREGTPGRAWTLLHHRLTGR